MGRLVLRADLDDHVARTLAAAQIAAIADRVRDEAARRAPNGKTWLSARDDRVRNSHREADGQEIPDNLRYEVPPARAGGQVEWAREPRDPDLSAGNAINCRCASLPLPRSVAESIRLAGPVTVVGPRVSATVQTFYPRAADSEFGTSRDPAARFMGGAVDRVAATLRGAGARRT